MPLSSPVNLGSAEGKITLDATSLLSTVQVVQNSLAQLQNSLNAIPGQLNIKVTANTSGISDISAQVNAAQNAINQINPSPINNLSESAENAGQQISNMGNPIPELMDIMSRLDSHIQDINISTQDLVALTAEAGDSVEDLGNKSEKSGSKLSKFGKLVSSVGATVAKVSAMAFSAAAAAISGLVKSASDGYAEYEQLVGGVKTIFTNLTGTITDFEATQEAIAAKTKEIAEGYNIAVEGLEKTLSETKKLYKKQEEALSDSVDKQIRLYKKSVEAQIDTVKNAQDAEVEAYQKATDEKLNLINAQYLEQLKLVDEEKYNKLKAIDDEIKAIQAEQKAEEEAQEARTQNAKLKELQSKLDAAAAEDDAELYLKAQKNLYDYQEQLRVKNNKKVQSDKIAQLKEEKSIVTEEAKKQTEAIKAEQKAQVEEYKNTRSEELKELKKQHSDELKAYKEEKDLEVEEYKRAKKREVEAFKEAKDEELEILKKSIEDQKKELEKNMKLETAQAENIVVTVETQVDEASADRAWQKVIENANNAYNTAGLSANKYMETVTSFSASLINSLGGDTEKAADVADTAIIDMADNVNKFGNNMASVQNAYQGFAKQNYTMLDNLKLGYGGTKAEMERLIDDANNLRGTVDETSLDHLNIESFADIVEAIHTIQQNMGITGATAEEAEGTITGSAAAAAAAWENLVTNLANQDADIESLIDKFLDAFLTAGQNLLPRIKEAFKGVGKLISKGIPIILQQVIPEIKSFLPDMINAAAQLVVEIAKALPEIANTLLEELPEIFQIIVDGIREVLPEEFQSIPEVLETTFNSLMKTIEEVTPAIGEVLTELLPPILDLINTLLPILTDLITNALKPISKLVKKLIEPIETIINTLSPLLTAIVDVIDTALTPLLDVVNLVIEALLGDDKSGLKLALDTICDLLENVVSPAFEAIAAYMSGDWIGGMEAVGKMFSGVFETAFGVIDTLFGTHLNDWFNSVKQWSFDLGKIIADTLNKNQNELNALENQYQPVFEDMYEKYANLVKSGKDAAEAIQEAYKDTFTSPEAQYIFKERFADDISGLTGAQKLGISRELSNQQIVDILSKGLSGTGRYRDGNTYNFYSPEALDEKTAAKEMKQANKELVYGF